MRNFLKDQIIFKRKICWNREGEKNYFNNFLEYLFYDGLNNDKHIDNFYNENLKCKIPFLNGGLFEPVNNYDWRAENLDLPNSIFSNKNEDGILDIFDLFNFTVDENQSIESDLAVDQKCR